MPETNSSDNKEKQQQEETPTRWWVWLVVVIVIVLIVAALIYWGRGKSTSVTEEEEAAPCGEDKEDKSSECAAETPKSNCGSSSVFETSWMPDSRRGARIAGMEVTPPSGSM